jgi:hypothetical protein
LTEAERRAKDKYRKTKRKVIGIEVDTIIKSNIDNYAHTVNQSVSNLMITALREKIDRDSGATVCAEIFTKERNNE